MRLTWLCSTSRPCAAPAARESHLPLPNIQAGRSPPRRALASVARVCGPDTVRARRRPVLEGVREPDRARQDAPDRRDDRLARKQAEHGCGLPRTRCLDRRARPRRGNPDARRGARRGAPLRGGCRGVRRGSTRGRCHRREGARGATALGRGLGEDAAGRASRVARVAHAREDRRRRRAVLRSRPRRGALSPRCLPLQAFQHLDRDRPFQRGLHDRGALRASVRPAPLEHPRLPLALLPAPARPRGCARGRRARARARPVAR